jgi:hypothetical protein
VCDDGGARIADRDGDRGALRAQDDRRGPRHPVDERVVDLAERAGWNFGRVRPACEAEEKSHEDRTRYGGWPSHADSSPGLGVYPDCGSAVNRPRVALSEQHPVRQAHRGGGTWLAGGWLANLSNLLYHAPMIE